MADKNKATTTTAAVKKDDAKPGLFKRIGKWFREMKSELKKVVWPTPKTLMKNVGIALVMIFLSAIVIWGFDQIAQMLVKALLSLAG